MNTTKTERGFVLIEFQDMYGQSCSLQESSMVTDVVHGNCVWLGQNGLERMHLSEKQVAELIPLLEHFVRFGALPYKPEPEPESNLDWTI